MVKLINPLEFGDPQNIKLLVELLKSNMMRLQWRKQKIFSVKDNKIELTHDILLTSPTNGQLSYYVVSNTLLGKGSYGKVYPIEHILVVLDEHIDTYKLFSPRVVKIQCQTYTNVYELIERRKHFIHEFNMSKLVPHLNIEGEKAAVSSNPIKNTTKFYIVMKSQPGVELFSLISMSYAKTWLMSSTVRLMITMALLRAFKSQVVDLEILHNDIKMENIIIDIGLTANEIKNTMPVDYSPQYVNTHFIDYAGSQKYGVTLERFIFTDKYRAPELRQGQIFSNEKTDIFSMGVVLKILWGFRRNVFSDVQADYSRYINQVYDEFYEHESFFSPDMLSCICNVIKSMIDENPDSRWSLSEVMQAFNAIDNDYQRMKNELKLWRDFDDETIPRPSPEGVTEIDEDNLFKPIWQKFSVNKRPSPADMSFFSERQTTAPPPPPRQLSSDPWS